MSDLFNDLPLKVSELEKLVAALMQEISMMKNMRPLESTMIDSEEFQPFPLAKSHPTLSAFGGGEVVFNPDVVSPAAVGVSGGAGIPFNGASAFASHEDHAHASDMASGVDTGDLLVWDDVTERWEAQSPIDLGLGWNLTNDDPEDVSLVLGDANAATGSSGDVARADHVHAVSPGISGDDGKFMMVGTKEGAAVSHAWVGGTITDAVFLWGKKSDGTVGWVEITPMSCEAFG